MRDIAQFVLSVLVVIVAIFAAGMLLDIAGRGQAGGFLQGIAKRVTNGFGDAQA